MRRLRDGDRRGAEELLAKSTMIEAKIILPALAWIDGGPDSVTEVLDASLTRERKEFERGLTFLGTLGNNAAVRRPTGHGHRRDRVVSPARRRRSKSRSHGRRDERHLGGAGRDRGRLVVALPAVVGYNLAQKKVAEIEANVSIITKQVLALLKSEDKQAREFRALREPAPNSEVESLPAPERELASAPTN